MCSVFRDLDEHLDDIIEGYGTPLVIYLESVAIARYAALSSSLPVGARLAYSVKANPNPAVIRIFADQGAFVEVASAGELMHVLRCGIEASCVLVGGPGKSDAYLDQGLRSGVRAFMVDSLSELGRLGSLTGRLGQSCEAVLRVNLRDVSSEPILRMGGAGSPFGIDELDIGEAISLCCADPLIRYAGLFSYMGSQYLHAKDIAANARALCALGQRTVGAGAPYPRILDFGGGFGVPEAVGVPSLDLDELRTGLQEIVGDYVTWAADAGSRPSLLFESGRFLAADAGVYVARIIDTKTSNSMRYGVTDGGINNLGVYQKQYRANLPIVELRQSVPSVAREPITLVGPTCTPIDEIGEYLLPPVRIGDLIIISTFGAYTTNFSPLHFCGHPWPAEVLIRTDGVVELTRRRGTLQEAVGPGYNYGRQLELES